MASGAKLAVLGYIGLGEFLLNAWGDLASTIATQLDSGTVTADEVASNLSTGAILAAQSMVLIVNEAFDAAAVMSGRQDQAMIVESQSFTTAAATGAVAGTLTLELAGPLVADLGNDSLPESVVAILPGILQPGDTTFHLEANATGHHAGGYSGNVEVLDGARNTVDTVSVWLTV